MGDDGVRVAAGVVLVGAEVTNMPGHEMAVAQALNAANAAVAPQDGPAVTAPEFAEGADREGEDDLVAGRSPEDRRALLIVREIRELRGAVETLIRVIERCD